MKILDKIRRVKGIVEAVVYGRFSSDMQREESIEAQVRAMEQFAHSNNIVIVGQYFDRAKSGTSGDREQFQQLVKDSVKRKFDLVLVHKMDRFARNRADSINTRLQLKRNGVTVIAVSQLYDSESPEGMMMEAMLEAMAEYYSKNLATEVEKGKRENALKGLHVGGKPPLGYDVDKATMKLIVNPAEAEAVKLIFRLANEEMGYEKISQELRRKGYKTKNGTDFGKNSLNSIMRNEKYIGIYVYSKSVPKDMDGKRNGHAYKHDDDIIRVENACPAIISKEEFEAVQARMTKRRRNQTGGRASAKEIYLLSGKIVCGSCGSNYEGIRRKPNGNHKTLAVSYRCGRHNKSISCDNGEINRDALERHVLEHLSLLVFNDDSIPEIVSGYNQYLRGRNLEAMQEVGRLKKSIAEVQKKIDNIVSAIETTGSLAMVDRLKSLESEKQCLDNDLYTIEKELDTQKVSVSEISEAFKQARELLISRSLSNAQQLVNTFVDKVTLHPDRVEISFNLGFKTEIFKDTKMQQPTTEKQRETTKRAVTQHNCVTAHGGEGATNAQNDIFAGIIYANPLLLWASKQTVGEIVDEIGKVEEWLPKIQIGLPHIHRQSACRCYRGKSER